ncbi:hypothetical protein D8B29_25005, partial [Verminephrobacter eiseniae]|nr:hypothetical protein [Verminephrobacter eiseniae]
MLSDQRRIDVCDRNPSDPSGRSPEQARCQAGPSVASPVASPIRCRRLRAAIGAQRKAHRAAHT